MRRGVARLSRGLLFLLLAVPLLLAGCGGEDSTAADPPQLGSDETRDFSGSTIDGEPVSLQTFQGRPTILIFWASW